MPEAPEPSPAYNLGSWPARRAAWAPDRLAVVDDRHRLSFAGFEERVARTAGLLVGHGVEPGDRVALLLANHSGYLEAVFAAARLGAIAMPINARLAAPEVAWLLRDSGPRLLLVESDLADLGRRAAAELADPPRLLAVGGDPDSFEARLAEADPIAHSEPARPDDAALLLYTSGTTGRPKGALLPQRKALYNALNAQLFFDLRSTDRVLVPVPLFHSFGLKILSLPAFYAGASVHLMRRFDADEVWRTVEAEGITTLGGVPTMFRRLLESLDRSPRRDTSSLRFLFTAGAPVPVELIRAFEARGLVLKQGFGQTETSILCCLDAWDAVRKAGSVGRPVFHAEVRVVRREDLAGPPSGWRDVEPGEPGEIVVRGPITMLGYWRQPAATAETLREGGWLLTGDLATVDEEGFLWLVGRAREIYISGGENVAPAEVEAALGLHPAVAEVAVIGVPDPEWGEAGRAFVVLRPGARASARELRRFAEERLARFKIPREFRFVESLPRTVTGKVQKHRLPRD